jgi:hypothetical protein
MGAQVWAGTEAGGLVGSCIGGSEHGEGGGDADGK